MKNLSYEERVVVENMLSNNYKGNAIALHLNRHRSSIFREIKRLDPSTGNYNAKYAHADMRAKIGTSIYKGPPKNIVQLIEEKLVNYQWSPEQISGWLKLKNIYSISFRWIYTYIEKDKEEGGELHNHLRHGNYIKARQPYKGPIKDRVSIEERAAVTNERKRLGDLEIDLIVGPKNRGAILTAIDRKSRLCILEKLSDKRAKTVTDKCIESLKNINSIFTITSDNGSEFIDHKKISAALNIEYYFAHPYASYERGSIENLNGLVRQYIPKKTSFTNIDNHYLKILEKKLNDRPRKILNYLTPHEYANTIKI